MSAKLHFHPLAQVAPAASLTTREWEALARVFGELEAEKHTRLYAQSGSFEDTPKATRIADAHSAIAEVAERIEAKVRDSLIRAGLATEDLFILVAPRIDHAAAAYLAESWTVDTTWPDLTWEVTVRLFGSKSAAKRSAEALRVEDAPVAPTLSEQHGAAKL